MKSQAYTFIERIKKSNPDKTDLTHEQISELAYEFQESITDVLSDKLINATQKFHAKTI
jgi:tRNA A37 threonylcarbamoyltransferase TsaD